MADPMPACSRGTAVGAYERIVLKSASTDAVAQFMAHRMGVDMDVDARP